MLTIPVLRKPQVVLYATTRVLLILPLSAAHSQTTMRRQTLVLRRVVRYGTAVAQLSALLVRVQILRNSPATMQLQPAALPKAALYTMPVQSATSTATSQTIMPNPPAVM